jgi:hypothetical protein
MRRSFQPSPAQLAALCCLGGVIAASSFLALSNPWTPPHQRPQHFLGLLILQVSLILIGSVIAHRSASSLELGIAAERWPEKEIDALRALLRSRNSTILTFVLLIGFIVLAFHAGRLRPAGWSLNVLLLTLNFLRAHIPSKPRPVGESKWANLSPLRSEHWGQR